MQEWKMTDIFEQAIIKKIEQRELFTATIEWVCEKKYGIY